jgi:hypothetical protein
MASHACARTHAAHRPSSTQATHYFSTHGRVAMVRAERKPSASRARADRDLSRNSLETYFLTLTNLWRAGGLLYEKTPEDFMRPPHHLQGTCLFSLERGEAGAPATQLSFINQSRRPPTQVRARAARRRHGRGPLPASLSLFLSCARVEACLAAVASPTLWRVPHCARGAGPRINESAPPPGVCVITASITSCWRPCWAAGCTWRARERWRSRRRSARSSTAASARW